MISNIVDILSKKLPLEINFSPTKLDSLVLKIKLVPIPNHVVQDDIFDIECRNENGGVCEEKILRTERNTGEKALVWIKNPKRLDKEEIEEGEEVKTVEREVEVEHEDRGLAISRHIDALPYSIYVMHTAAPRL